MVGGNMRQAGPLAAAGIVALETMTGRLEEDHANAMRLALALNAIDATLVDPADVETNLVRVNLPKNGPAAAEWSAALEKQRILVSPCARYALRFVTHRHISASDVDEAARAIASVWTSQRETPRARV
jgi:threonine aldolase